MERERDIDCHTVGCHRCLVGCLMAKGAAVLVARSAVCARRAACLLITDLASLRADPTRLKRRGGSNMYDESSLASVQELWLHMEYALTLAGCTR